MYQDLVKNLGDSHVLFARRDGEYKHTDFDNTTLYHWSVLPWITHSMYLLNPLENASDHDPEVMTKSIL